jgi:two-component system OmpR family response regulator
MSHILVVEDEEHLAQGIKFNLQAEGYTVTTVDNGADAVGRVVNGDATIDLVILDLMLPGMSGYAVCEQLRESGALMPILILSARTLTEDRTRGFDMGADQYLTKPFELDELLARVKGLLTRHRRLNGESGGRSNLPSQMEIGRATVNFANLEVMRDDVKQRMTPLEIRLLQYLFLNEGRIVSRQELMEHVWEQPGYVQTRAPDQFIRRLRKLFEDEPSNPKHFLTIRDAGYMFVSQPEDEQE